ncbi:hypothetical protein EVAR_91881_1 [Eumeta japonica]|uniref:Uncharacterized protein n=1 Tax=Eumeta variegata TaxID=151549 RepID=A0A4C1SIF1_EUMVA|nr:hypothetical protein EVAR_91881_1 [Eumeta japonica]
MLLGLLSFASHGPSEAINYVDGGHDCKGSRSTKLAGRYKLLQLRQYIDWESEISVAKYIVVWDKRQRYYTRRLYARTTLSPTTCSVAQPRGFSRTADKVETFLKVRF